MKKNRTMKAASILLALCLMTSCFVGGTFAKYTTSVSDTVTARVAKWGFNATTLTLDALFSETYTIAGGGAALSDNGDAIVAPGTAGTTTFKFSYLEPSVEPEVKYTFTVDASITGDVTDLDKNENFKWTLKCNDGAATVYATSTDLTNAIKKLSGETDGSADYAAGTLPADFNANQVYTIGWYWDFGDGSDVKVYDTDADDVADMTQDEFDTYMGNKALADLDEFTLSITITAEQIGD